MRARRLNIRQHRSRRGNCVAERAVQDIARAERVDNTYSRNIDFAKSGPRLPDNWIAPPCYSGQSRSCGKNEVEQVTLLNIRWQKSSEQIAISTR